MRDTLLLVEDSSALNAIYEALLTRQGYAVHTAFTAAEARAAHAKMRNRVVLLDLMLPDGDGIDVMAEMRRDCPDVKVIAITANGSINRAVAAMRAGAFDFLVKPFDEARLINAVESARLDGGVEDASPPHLQDEHRFGDFIGGSPAMQAIYDTIAAVGRSSATVFITGESGTGKELCAQALHRASTRRGKPFVPLNCGAIPHDLLESEVFGHLKGSFTGAIADKPGAAAAADGGTLFLDEVCEMDLDLQTKLLRFLQTSTIQPVGATQPRKVDVRIVCATNRDPEAEVAEGRFRSDLFYRLFVVPIELPPLRARGRDVLFIARTLLTDYAREEGKLFRRFSAEVERAFQAYPWPGNIRELQNVLRNVVVRRDGEEVTLEMLPSKFLSTSRADPARLSASVSARVVESDGGLAAGLYRGAEPETLRGPISWLVGAPLSRVERELIEATIDACDGSIPKAARMLDVSPSTLYRKRENWSIKE